MNNGGEEGNYGFWIFQSEHWLKNIEAEHFIKSNLLNAIYVLILLAPLKWESQLSLSSSRRRL